MSDLRSRLDDAEQRLNEAEEGPRRPSRPSANAPGAEAFIQIAEGG